MKYLDNMVLDALNRLGPSPVRISRETKLTVMAVQQLIIGNPKLRTRYQQLLDEIYAAIGIFGLDLKMAAEYLGRRRIDLETYIKENAVLQHALDDIRLALTDAAEVNLAKAVARGEWNATQFALERTSEGARRGYGQRRVVDVAAEAEALNVDPRVLRDKLVRALLADEQDAGVQGEKVVDERVD